MISFPNGKINLGLYVTAKRPDGYHDLETVFFPLPLHDILEFVPSDHTRFHATGIPIGGDASSNLCLKAYHILRQLHSGLPDLDIHLHKLIPMGAGLGGGSSDGAFMLTMLNRQFRLGHTPEDLMSLALQLGSDCPFFILNQPAHALGRGEILQPLRIDLIGYCIVIVNPGIHVSTAEAFSGIRPGPCPIDLKTRILESPEGWKHWLSNDFEASVFRRFPLIAGIRQSLYDAGAVYASMSGSGSTVYGIFRGAPVLSFPPEFMVRTLPINH